MLTRLARSEAYAHPLLELPGWWQRPDRFCYPFPAGSSRVEKEEKYRFGNGTTAYWNHNKTPSCEDETLPEMPQLTDAADASSVRPVVITGGAGALAQAFARQCAERGIPYRLLTRQDLDITDARAIDRVLDTLQPWALINAAGYAGIKKAELEPQACLAANSIGSVRLATACAKRGVAFLNFSSDWVFDGRKTIPYVESDPVAPLNVYGHSKAEAERGVLRVHPASLIVRAGAFFGPWDAANPLTRVLGQLLSGGPVTVPADHVHSPAYLPDLVHACLDLLVDGERGIWHLSNGGAVTTAALAKGAAELLGLDAALIRETRPSGLKKNTVLHSERGNLLPALEDALARYCEEAKLRNSTRPSLAAL